MISDIIFYLIYIGCAFFTWYLLTHDPKVKMPFWAWIFVILWPLTWALSLVLFLFHFRELKW